MFSGAILINFALNIESSWPPCGNPDQRPTTDDQQPMTDKTDNRIPMTDNQQ